MKNRKGKIVVVSGGFDPAHVGHLRMFKEARALGDHLVVILNNDNWLHKKKRRVFMSEEERREMLEALSCVDEVVISSHPENPTDMSTCRELEAIRPHIFANGGDRRSDKDIPEDETCRNLGIKMIFNVGGDKIQSSSDLLDAYGNGVEE